MRILLFCILQILITNSIHSQYAWSDKDIENHIDSAFENLDTIKINIAIRLAKKKKRNGLLCHSYNTKGYIYQKHKNNEFILI